MTDSQLALMRAIRDAPTGETSRTVYAGCLEKNGFAEWASFIRLL